jgi:hypothetical protein
MVKFLIGKETAGFDIGVEQWVLARAHLGIIVHGLLQGLLFEGGVACRDHTEYQTFLAEHRALKQALYRILESYTGPSALQRRWLAAADKLPYLGWAAKYFAYHLNDRALRRALADFGARWIKGRRSPEAEIHIALTGELYMRAAQAEEIFQLLLANLGFRRFRLGYTPIWSYMEWAFDEAIEAQRDRLERLQAVRVPTPARGREAREAVSQVRVARTLQFILRNFMARPLYRAAGLPMPLATRRVLQATRELIPTLRPLSEIATYTGEVLHELRHGADLVLNVAPNGCMVATMGEALTPALLAEVRGEGRIQHLFSADGDVNEELLTLAVLKAMGPEGYYRGQGSRSPGMGMARGVPDNAPLATAPAG